MRDRAQGATAEALVRATPTVRCTVVGLAIGLIAFGVAFNLLSPERISIGSVFAAAPLVVAPFLSARLTWLIGLLALGSLCIVVYGWYGPGVGEATIRMVNVLVVFGLALGINYLARTNAAQLASTRNIAEAAQRAVMPVPPARLGGLDIAARYEAAQAGARIGGDLYAVQETPYGVRMLVGDVRGKGMGAVEAVSVALGSFREVAEQEVSLSVVAQRLERSLLRDVEQRGGPEVYERFVTAVLAEVPPGRPGLLRLINCGHPPPLLLLPDGEVRSLDPAAFALPMAMGHLLPQGEPYGRRRVPPRPGDEVDFPPGSLLLLYTDGISEARDRGGVFYDPMRRLSGRRFSGPQELLDELLTDMSRHTGGVVEDDIALLAVARPAMSDE